MTLDAISWHQRIRIMQGFIHLNRPQINASKANESQQRLDGDWICIVQIQLCRMENLSKTYWSSSFTVDDARQKLVSTIAPVFTEHLSSSHLPQHLYEFVNTMHGVILVRLPRLWSRTLYYTSNVHVDWPTMKRSFFVWLLLQILLLSE